MLERKGDLVRIQYSGHNSVWAEWVSKDRVSPVEASVNRDLYRKINAELIGK